MSTILADITSGDPARVYAAMWAVLRLRDPDELDALAASLPEIERATADVDLGGLLRPNRELLEFAFRKLRYHRDGAGCLCRLYPEFLLYDPETEAGAGHVRILETREDETWRCECTPCGTAFEVRYGEAHASWWEWELAG